MGKTVSRLLCIAAFAALLVPPPALAEERVVLGTIERIDAAGAVFTVKDAAGASWTYKVAADAGIALSTFRAGDRVAVTIGRATPLNMITTGDLLKKGDRVEKTGY